MGSSFFVTAPQESQFVRAPFHYKRALCYMWPVRRLDKYKTFFAYNLSRSKEILWITEISALDSNSTTT